MKIVGTNHGGYANARNIADMPLRNYKVVRCRNAFRLPNYLYFKLRGKMHPYLPWLHWDAGLANYDLLHFFNGISLGKRPWLSTFETYLPRWGSYGGKRIAWGLEKMAGPSCKRLIALSQCTLDIQRKLLADHPAFAEAIMAKTCVLHPPQAPLLDIAALDLKLDRLADAHRPIECLFVGADFFRKGGLEMLQAFDALLAQGAPLRLSIVSTMQFGDYASQTTAQDLATARAIMQRHPSSIRWHASIPYGQVMALCREADLGLLPTWADTYGYSALEFMAAGCPVISTDIRALPEINGADRGLIIACAKDDWGNAILATPADRAAFSAHLRERITATLTDIVHNPRQLQAKGHAAYAHILARHSPTAAAATLEQWYDAALQ
jgi:glycosyltransferase involved in cell wall biosynthesis